MKNQDPRQWQGSRIVTEDDLMELKAETHDPELVDHPEHFRNRLRHGLVLTFILLLVAAMGLTAYLVLTRKVELPFLPMGPTETAVAEAEDCPAGDFTYLDPEAITVDVFNGTLRAGLASTVRDALADRGFVQGRVGNQQLSNRGAIAALVVSGEQGRDEALTVQRHIPGSEYAYEPRLGDGHVVVILGEAYETLTATPYLKTEDGPLACGE
ncbi:hypothetical protein GCM10027591_09960 [Zhihengliuella somnathii]